MKMLDKKHIAVMALGLALIVISFIVEIQPTEEYFSAAYKDTLVRTPDGTLWIAYAVSDQMYVRSSVDGGETWLEPIGFPFPEPEYTTIDYPPELATDSNGHLLLVWEGLYESTKVVAYSKYDGSEWSEPVTVQNVINPRVAIGPNDVVHFVSYYPGEYCAYYYLSSPSIDEFEVPGIFDGEEELENSVWLFDNPDEQTEVAISVDSTGRPYVFFTSLEEMETYVRWSEGGEWVEPVTLLDDFVAYLPNVEVDANNRFHLGLSGEEEEYEYVRYLIVDRQGNVLQDKKFYPPDQYHEYLVPVFVFDKVERIHTFWTEQSEEGYKIRYLPPNATESVVILEDAIGPSVRYSRWGSSNRVLDNTLDIAFYDTSGGSSIKFAKFEYTLPPTPPEVVPKVLELAPTPPPTPQPIISSEIVMALGLILSLVGFASILVLLGKRI